MTRRIEDETLALLRRMLNAPPPAPETPPSPVLAPSDCRPLPPFPGKAPRRARAVRPPAPAAYRCSECKDPVQGDAVTCADCPKHPLAIIEPIPASTDPRAITNTKVHVEVPHNGPAPQTPAQAAKLRRKAMTACMCRLCALALAPPAAFAEAEQLGLRQPNINALREQISGWHLAAAIRRRPRPLMREDDAVLSDLDAMEAA